MNIPLGNGYRLSADSRQWIMQKEGEKTEIIDGEKVKVPSWSSISFHGSINAAINHHADYLLRTSDAKSIEEAHEACKRILAELTQALSPVFDVQIHKAGVK